MAKVKYPGRLTEIFQITLLLVASGALPVHQVVKPPRALQEVIQTTQNTEDTKGEDPDADNGDDRGLSADEPSENTE